MGLVFLCLVSLFMLIMFFIVVIFVKPSDDDNYFE